MVVTLQSPRSAWISLLFSLYVWASAVIVVSGHEHSLFFNQNTTLQLSRGLPVGNSPGSKPGATVVCERVYINGLSRLQNLGKFAHSMKVKVLPTNSDVRHPNIEICFHRNLSIGVGMCPQGQWEKVTKGTWARSMSPFDHRVLDIRTGSSTLENIEVSIEEEFNLFRIVFLIIGVILMNLASFLSKSLAFYYSSAMAVGIILVILMILFQGMKLLPTGRKNSLAIFLYSSAVGFGTFLLRYVPRLIRSVLTELGINEDMYNPVFGNISAGFCCASRSLVGILGGTQACSDRRRISGCEHLSLCCMGHPDIGCCHDPSEFYGSYIGNIGIIIRASPPVVEENT